MSSMSENVWDSVFWIFRSYDDVRDWLSREESAGIVSIIMGVLLGRLGYSPGITGALTAIGLATMFAKVAIRIVVNRDTNVLERMNRRRKGLATAIYVFIGLLLHLFIVEGALQAVRVTVIQFVIGILFVYLAGVVHMFVYTVVEDSTGSVRQSIIFSILTTVGVMFVLLVGIPELALNIGKTEFYSLFKNLPSEVGNQSVKNVTGFSNKSVVEIITTGGS